MNCFTFKLSSCSIRESFAKKLHTPALLEASAPALLQSSILLNSFDRIDHRDLGIGKYNNMMIWRIVLDCTLVRYCFGLISETLRDDRRRLDEATSPTRTRTEHVRTDEDRLCHVVDHRRPARRPSHTTTACFRFWMLSYVLCAMCSMHACSQQQQQHKT
jgi:hypothetical protein